MPTPVLSILNDTLRRMVPLASIVLLLALSLAPVPGARALGLAATLPPLALMGVFYWSVYRPDRFGIVAAFVIGALADLLMGAPVGVTAFLYAATQRTVRQQQRLFRGGTFVLLWTGYMVVQLAVSTLQWAAWSWLSHIAYPVAPFAVQLAFGLCLFPPVYFLLSRLHASFLHYAA